MFWVTQNLSSYSRKHLPIGRYLSKVEYLNQPIGKYRFANMMMSDLLTYWFIVVLIYRQKVLYICLYVYHSFEQTLERSIQPFFYTPYSSDLFAFAKLRIVIRFISFHNSFIKNKKIKIRRVYHSFHNSWNYLFSHWFERNELWQFCIWICACTI